MGEGDDWDWKVYGSYEFYIDKSDTYVSWYEGNERCLQNRALLASMTSRQEKSVIDGEVFTCLPVAILSEEKMIFDALLHIKLVA